MKNFKYYVQAIMGLVLAFAIMVSRGLFESTTLADKVKYIGDGFTVAGILYLGVGALLWVSTTGFFDIFSYAIKKAAHAILPGMVQDDVGKFYEYKVENESKRKGFFEYFTLKLGVLFTVISLILLYVWYQV